MYNHYVGTVEMEAKCMVDMIKQHIIPSCKAADMAVRKLCDKAEEDVPADLWTIATYKDLLFLDATNGAEIVDYE